MRECTLDVPMPIAESKQRICLNSARWEAGPLAKEKCAPNLKFGAREGVCKLFNFTIDEVWDYTMSPIVGLQNALLVEKHEMRLLDSADKFARCAHTRHRHR